MLTMADMGMKGMDGPGGMAGMDMSGGGDMEGMEMSGGGGGGGGGHDGMDGMAGMDASGGEPLPVENLPDNVMHGPDDHGRQLHGRDGRLPPLRRAGHRVGLTAGGCSPTPTCGAWIPSPTGGRRPAS